MHILELSEYQLYQLKSIDPALSGNWKAIINKIFPQLDELSRKSIYKKILSKRNISPNFTYIAPDDLRTVLFRTAIRNKELKAISIKMLKLIESEPISYDAIELADRVEALVDYLNRINIGDNISDQKSRRLIKNAFLYDLAAWVDHIELIVEPGIRKLDSDIVKVYFKEVFIKQKILERSFRAWDSTDIDFQNQQELPNIIREQAQLKKFFVIESKAYWFLIGIADKPHQNPYSFKRFLYEESSGNNLYVYLTHVVIRKSLLNKERYIQHIVYCMSRLYTLDRGVSDSIIKFIHKVQHSCSTQIAPLLKKPLKKDGEDTEYHINKRMNEYEQQISVLILNKLPNVIKNTVTDNNDRDYLFYYLDKILNKMVDNIEDFQLQPIAIYSYSAEIMTARLISYREFLNKIYLLLEDKSFDIKGFASVSKNILTDIKKDSEEVKKDLKKIEQLEEKLQNYYTIKETGNFWQKIINGRMPNYNLEDINHSKNEVRKSFFLSIVRLSKTNSSNIIYLEFECNEVVNENFRHYAIADEKMSLIRLPKILRLPEDRMLFDIQKIDNAINHNAFIISES